MTMIQGEELLDSVIPVCPSVQSRLQESHVGPVCPYSHGAVRTGQEATGQETLAQALA